MDWIFQVNYEIFYNDTSIFQTVRCGHYSSCWIFNWAIVHMNYVIEGSGALVNEKGEEQPLEAGDFALVNPDEKHQYRNKGDKPFKMICGVPKEFE